MSHDHRRQVSRGAILVRVRSGNTVGLGVMLLDRPHDPERFVTDSRGRVVLAGRTSRLSDVFALAASQEPRVSDLLSQVQPLRATRRFSTAAFLRMVEAPASEWRWIMRGRLLYRLDMAWTLLSSMGDDERRALLNNDRPLGQLAEMCFEDFEGDDEMRTRLDSVDLHLAARDARAVGEAVHRGLVVQ